MLAKYWRLHIYWVADQTLTYNNDARIVVRSSPWKLVSGDLSYGTTIVDDMGLIADGSLATTNSLEGDVNDNTSNLYWGIKGYFEVTADQDSTDGTAYLYLEESDDNSNWPSDQADFDVTDLIMVAALTMSTDAVDESRGINFAFGAY